MKYKYIFDEPKKEIGMVEMSDIHHYYEAACTAEYIADNYKSKKIKGLNEDELLKLGYDVRRLMDKYGYDELEAIREVINDL